MVLNPANNNNNNNNDNNIFFQIIIHAYYIDIHRTDYKYVQFFTTHYETLLKEESQSEKALYSIEKGCEIKM